MAYTTYQLVEAQLGVTLTAAQRTHVTNVLEPAARDQLDRWAGRHWQIGSPVTAEAHLLGSGDYLYLDQKPVTALTSITVQWGPLDTAPTTLTAGTQYSLYDAAQGLVYLPGYEGALAKVTYTHANGVPEDVQYAATLYVGSMIQPALSGAAFGSSGGSGIKSYEVAGEERVTYFGPSELSASGEGDGRSVPEWERIARSYRRRVFA